MSAPLLSLRFGTLRLYSHVFSSVFAGFTPGTWVSAGASGLGLRASNQPSGPQGDKDNQTVDRLYPIAVDVLQI